VGLIVNGFCKEVLKELPMEFAVEAQKLLAVSLKARWVNDAGNSRNLHASIGDKPILKRHRSDGAGGRGPRHHGAERLRQIHAVLRAGRGARIIR
jgi:hypothetical protein